MPGQKVRLGVGLVASVLLASACGVSFQRSGASREVATPEPAPVGGAVETPIAPDQPPTATGEQPQPGGAGGPAGAMVVSIVDANGRAIPGVPARISGPVDRELTSDESGQIVIEAPSGHYDFEVPLVCTETLRIMESATARFAIAAGQEGHGSVELRWEHRFTPGGFVVADHGPSWPVGQEVRMRYDVLDRCGDLERAPNRELPTWRLEMSSNLRTTSSPVFVSDADGYGHLQLSCLEEGPIRLVLFDSWKLDDRFDLAAADWTTGVDPRCAP